MAVNLNYNLDKLLKQVQYQDNILEYYDNVTYNIRFYMINSRYQIKLSQDRSNGIIPNNYRLPDNSKIIIAETGVSAKYSIESLKMSTLYTSASNNESATTYNMELKLKEIGGCSLINKITVISKLLEYENYILQPFHIDIWFTGYDHYTHKPVKVIDNKVYTYEVMLSEVKTNCDNTGTSYNIIMTAATTGCLNKQINCLNDIGQLDIKSGTMKDYKIAIEKAINEKFFKNNPNIKNLYPDNKFFQIDGLIRGDVSRVNSTAIKILNKRDELKNNPIEFYQSMDNVTVNELSKPQNTDKEDGGLMKTSSDSTFDSFFQKLCFNTKDYKNYIARPVYRVEYIGNKNGQQLQKIHAYIVFNKNNYLEYYAKNAKLENRADINYDTYVRDMQENELKELIKSDSLQKKYQWQYNGTDTSVLEFNSSLDMLWYSNIPSPDIIKVAESSNDMVNKVKHRDIIEKYNDILRNKVDDNKNIESVIASSNKFIEPVKNLTADKRFYIDDLYNCISDKFKNETLYNRKILETYNSYGVSGKESENVDINDDTQIAKAGYNNIYKSGNLIELKIKILGDPYWIDLCSDNNLYKSNDEEAIIDSAKFPNVAFQVKTALGQKPDGTEDFEGIINFSSIYQIIETSSFFEGGKFIQELTGVINNAFLHCARLKV